MKTIFIFLVVISQFITATATADNLMTARDILSDSHSNVTLTNQTENPITTYGVYINKFGYVAAGDSCDNANLIYTGDIALGAMVNPLAFKEHEQVKLGSNYLYNMIYSAIYFANLNNFSPCMLPGCRWGGDNRPYQWCIYIGVLANIPPYGSSVNVPCEYNYNLVNEDEYSTIGPISCDDHTLSCTVANPQNQAFSESVARNYEGCIRK